VSSVVCFVFEKIITTESTEKRRENGEKFNCFFSVFSVFLCVLCGSFPFMLKTYHRGNGEKQRKQRRTMKIGKNR